MGGIVEELWFVAVPAYFFLQFFMATRYRGGWLIAAVVPLIVMVPVVLHALVAFIGGSNLWPVLVFLTSPVAFIYLVVLGVVRAVKT